MARRGGFTRALVRQMRESERRRQAQVTANLHLQKQRAQAAEKAAREAERARLAMDRATTREERLRHADEMRARAEEVKRYAAARAQEAAERTESVEAFVNTLTTLLLQALRTDSYLDPRSLKKTLERPSFNGGPLAVAEAAPTLEAYLPAKPPGVGALVPWVKRRYLQEREDAEAKYRSDVNAHAAREARRTRALAEAQSRHWQHIHALQEQEVAQHAEIDAFVEALARGEPAAITEYSLLILEASEYPEGFPQQTKGAYVPESRQLVLEYDLPPLDIVPLDRSYKWVKAQDEIVGTPQVAAQRKALYASVVAQVTLRSLHELFEADRRHHVESVVFNGYVGSVDPGTGRQARTCLVTVRTTREAFEHLDLSRVDPIACLKTLNASVSKSPSELAPVRPILEFDMVDPRFVDKSDVLSQLDQRANLMDLDPNEFEALITNLFEKMGMETRLTQASRDGGVDCVAYDPRPIFGGKIVIQAKRYKHTVGVSAVRDLYGTVQNEGASKGILVTTSGYGKAAYDFAAGKPLELLSGSNLLYLLAEHAGIEAKIEMPDNWNDPRADSDPDA